MTEALQPIQASPAHPYEADAPHSLVVGEAYVASAKKPVKYHTLIPADTADFHLLMANGYGAYHETSATFQRALADEGIATTTYAPPREHSREHSTLTHAIAPQLLHYDALKGVRSHQLHNIEYHRKAGGDAVLYASQIVLGHSMGNIPALRYAAHHPENLDTVISLQGVGMEARLGLKIAGRFPAVLKDIGSTVLKGDLAVEYRTAHRALYHLARNPVRSAAEAAYCMTADERGMSVLATSRGVRHLVILGERDAFFLHNEVLLGMRDTDAECSVIEDVTHIGPQIESKARIIASHIKKLLTEDA